MLIQMYEFYFNLMIVFSNLSPPDHYYSSALNCLPIFILHPMIASFGVCTKEWQLGWLW